MKFKSKVQMPQNIRNKCHAAIHTASSAAAAAGAIPIPISDTIPITTAQISMIVALGKVFDVSLSQSAAKAIASITVVQQAGRAIFTKVLKSIPGAGPTVGCLIGGATAAALTEGLGWLVADDFYRMSKGQEPIDIPENIGNLKGLFDK